jgi:hypothetical protein
MSLVHQVLKIRAIKHGQLLLHLISKTSHECPASSFVGSHLARSIAGKLVELMEILSDGTLPLLEGKEFISLSLH